MDETEEGTGELGEGSDVPESSLKLVDMGERRRRAATEPIKGLLGGPREATIFDGLAGTLRPATPLEIAQMEEARRASLVEQRRDLERHRECENASIRMANSITTLCEQMPAILSAMAQAGVVAQVFGGLMSAEGRKGLDARTLDQNSLEAVTLVMKAWEQLKEKTARTADYDSELYDGERELNQETPAETETPPSAEASGRSRSSEPPLPDP